MPAPADKAGERRRQAGHRLDKEGTLSMGVLCVHGQGDSGSLPAGTAGVKASA
jgi:hypothetical protein